MSTRQVARPYRTSPDFFRREVSQSSGLWPLGEARPQALQKLFAKPLQTGLLSGCSLEQQTCYCEIRAAWAGRRLLPERFHQCERLRDAMFLRDVALVDRPLGLLLKRVGNCSQAADEIGYLREVVPHTVSCIGIADGPFHASLFVFVNGIQEPGHKSRFCLCLRLGTVRQ